MVCQAFNLAGKSSTVEHNGLLISPVMAHSKPIGKMLRTSQRLPERDLRNDEQTANDDACNNERPSA